MSVLPFTVLVIGLVAAAAVDRLAFGGSPLFPRAGNLIAAVTGLAALIIYLLRWRTLHRWDAGIGPPCPRCGGPLGTQKAGKVYYGKQLPDYRTCWNCGRHSGSD